MVTFHGARTGPVAMPPEVDSVSIDARRSAATAATRAGVVVTDDANPDVLERVCDLFELLWQEQPGDRAMTPLVLRALTHAGNYLGVAWHGEEVVGACVGFVGLDPQLELHSHIAGVSGEARGRSVGFALKVHQRAWALHRGLGTVSWSFDPLIRRNAYFNIGKLAAGVRDYRASFYGPMSDGINAGDDSDRLIAEWDVSGQRVATACAGWPALVDAGELRKHGAVVALTLAEGDRPVAGDTDGGIVLVAVPADIEALRGIDAGLAREWRSAVRDVLGGLLSRGGRVIGFARSGYYVVRREDQ